MRRREFITLGRAAATWPLAARAQQGDRVRRIVVLTTRDENDPVAKTYVSAFIQALADLGWTNGGKTRIDLRSAGTDIYRIRAFAQELVNLQADIIVTGGGPGNRRRAAGDADDPDRLCDRGRSPRQWPRSGAQPPGREHHWLHPIGGLICRQVA